jgi:septal ring factor EnvC (AmiA/AmiB activator)
MEIASWITPVIGGVTALLVSLLGALVASQVERKRKKEAPSLEDRITALAKSLKSSLSVISEIESEIESRSQIVSKLKDDVKRYEKLKELNEAQVEAIAQTIRGEISGESRKSLWRNALITFGVAMIFFFLGFWLRGA